MTGPSRTDAQRPAAHPSAMQKRVLLGGSVGQFVEFYDFSLYAFSAVILSHTFFPKGNDFVGLLATFATFGVAFIARPIGGLFFGQLGDRIGRRRVLYVTLLAIGAATACIGILPGYDTIGWLAPLLLVTCRLIQGFSAGGESVGAPAFVFEHAPVNRRGFWLNITLAATALPSVVAGVLLLGLSKGLPEDAFSSWGWRLPFLLALPLSLIGIWIRSHTEESEAFKKVAAKVAQREYSPIREAFRENGLRMIQVIVVMGMTAMGFYMLAGYFVSYVQTTGNLSRAASLGVNAIAMLAYAILLPIGGVIGDRYGRKPMLVAGSIALALLGLPCFMLVTSGHIGLALLGQLLFVVLLCIYGGGCYTFFVEIFDTKTRFTSAAISYNCGYALFGGTAPLISTWLVGKTGVPYSPGFWLSGFAVLVFLFLTLTKVPETRGRHA